MKTIKNITRFSQKLQNLQNHCLEPCKILYLYRNKTNRINWNSREDKLKCTKMHFKRHSVKGILLNRHLKPNIFRYLVNFFCRFKALEQNLENKSYSTHLFILFQFFGNWFLIFNSRHVERTWTTSLGFCSRRVMIVLEMKYYVKNVKLHPIMEYGFKYT